jgi:uncharacterized protein YidB (DUF937 family)
MRQEAGDLSLMGVKRLAMLQRQTTGSILKSDPGTAAASGQITSLEGDACNEPGGSYVQCLQQCLQQK